MIHPFGKNHSITGKIYHVLKYFLFLYNSKKELPGVIAVFKGPEETGLFKKRRKVLDFFLLNVGSFFNKKIAT